MLRINTITKYITIAGIVALTGCAGRNVQSPNQGDYVEVKNPAFTMSPGAPEMIWVPRSYVDTGIARGGEVVKKGFEAVTGTEAPAVNSAPAPAVKATANPIARQSAITGPGGTPAQIIPQFGLVVAVDGEKIYFNLGREAGIKPGQLLKIYRGGTVIEGLGLAPGERVGVVELIDFVGSKGGYGVIKHGGPVQKNDLIGAE